MPPDFFRQIGAHRIFRVKMAGINQIQPQVLGVPEAVVLDIRGHKGVATGGSDFGKKVCAGPAAYGNAAAGLPGADIPEPLAAQFGFYRFQELLQGLFRNQPLADSPGPAPGPDSR